MKNASDIRSLARFNFVSGLPRSGVAVLTAILCQNPRFTATVASSGEALLRRGMRRLSDGGEDADLLDDGQKMAFMRSLLDSVHHDRMGGSVVFDANREWLMHVDTLVHMYPLCRFIICLRNPAAIVNAMLLAEGVAASDKARARSIDAMTGPDSDLATSITMLRNALSSDHAERMFILDYDRLTDDPEEAMDVLYDFLREPEFHHDFQDIGGHVPGIGGPVIRSSGPSVLPARTLLQLSGRAFWRNLRRTSATMLLGRAR